MKKRLDPSESESERLILKDDVVKKVFKRNPFLQGWNSKNKNIILSTFNLYVLLSFLNLKNNFAKGFKHYKSSFCWSSYTCSIHSWRNFYGIIFHLLLVWKKVWKHLGKELKAVKRWVHFCYRNIGTRHRPNLH